MRTFLKLTISTVILLLIVGFGTYYWLTIPPTQVKSPIIKGVHYVGMSVSNLSNSSDLYQKAFNVQTVGKETNGTLFDNHLIAPENALVSSQLLKSANAQLRLMQFHQPSEHAMHAHHVGPNGPGIAHVCFQVNKNTQAYQTFLAGGATSIGSEEMVQVNPKNPVYYAYAYDDDKIMVEVEHVDVPKLNLPTPPKNDYRIRHVSLATNDMDRAVKFYSTLLETKNPRRAGRLLKLQGDKVDQITGFNDTKIQMAWFQVRNLELEIIQYYNPAPTTLSMPRPIDALGYNMIVFDVTDLEQVKNKIKTAGGTIVSEPVPADGGQIMYARDLDGNLLGFQTLPKHSLLSATNFKDNGI